MIMPRSHLNLDIDLIRSFVTIVSLGNFTRAAEALGLQQSTISLQIRRLEQLVGGKLLERSPQAVALTPEGDTFFDYARRMLDLNDEMVARIREPAVRGLVRLGAPEDFATRHLPDVLARFAHAYPQVDLEVTCDLTMNLIERFRKGAFDLALIKRERSIELPGTRVWREPLVWVTGGVDLRQGLLPLAVSPKPCVYRKRATEALDRARRSWRVAYTCGSAAARQQGRARRRRQADARSQGHGNCDPGTRPPPAARATAQGLRDQDLELTARSSSAHLREFFDRPVIQRSRRPVS